MCERGSHDENSLGIWPSSQPSERCFHPTTSPGYSLMGWATGDSDIQRNTCQAIDVGSLENAMRRSGSVRMTVTVSYSLPVVQYQNITDRKTQIPMYTLIQLNISKERDFASCTCSVRISLFPKGNSQGIHIVHRAIDFSGNSASV